MTKISHEDCKNYAFELAEAKIFLLNTLEKMLLAGGDPFSTEYVDDSKEAIENFSIKLGKYQKEVMKNEQEKKRPTANEN